MSMTLRQLLLYREHSETISAREILRGAMAASVPHMTEDGREEFLADLREAAQVDDGGREVNRISFEDFKREIKGR